MEFVYLINVSIVSDYVGYIGIGFVVGFDVEKEVVEFDVDVVDGVFDYIMEVCYSVGVEDVIRIVYINGKK